MTVNRKATKSIAIALIASFTTVGVLPVGAAEAGQRQYMSGHKNHSHSHRHVTKRKIVKRKIVRKHRGHRNRDNGADALAAGVIGFAIGAIIADQASKPRVTYVQPEPVYVAPQPVYREPYVQRRPLTNAYDNNPRVIRYEDQVNASYEPWTPEWAEWCDNRYRSFNINTGTFRGYDGKDHFCVVK